MIVELIRASASQSSSRPNAERAKCYAARDARLCCQSERLTTTRRRRPERSASVLAPKQRSAVHDAIAGYLANYETAWREGQIEDYFLFPGSTMRMLDASGRRGTRRI